MTHLGLKNGVDRLDDVGLEDLCLGDLLVPVGGQPDPGQRALLAQHEHRVEHGCGRRLPQRRERVVDV